MSNDKPPAIKIVSKIADGATITGNPVKVWHENNMSSILLKVKDGMNNEASYIFLDMEQAEFLGIWLMARVEEAKAAKLTGKV